MRLFLWRYKFLAHLRGRRCDCIKFTQRSVHGIKHPAVTRIRLQYWCEIARTAILPSISRVVDRSGVYRTVTATPRVSCSLLITGPFRGRGYRLLPAVAATGPTPGARFSSIATFVVARQTTSVVVAHDSAPARASPEAARWRRAVDAAR